MATETLRFEGQDVQGNPVTRDLAVTIAAPPAAGLPLFGAAVGGNASPSYLEGVAGRPLGVRRTYYTGASSSVTSGINTAQADQAAGRVPWVSFKLPASWAAMASGSQDGWLNNLGTRLRALPKMSWVSLHHEPENDGPIADWNAMQRRAAPMIRAANVKFAICVTGWHQFFSTATTYSMLNCWPGDGTGIDIIGIDPYNEYGVSKDGGATRNLKLSELGNQKIYYDKLAAFAKAHGTQWAVGETGFTDRCVADHGVQWLHDAYDMMANHPVQPGLGLAYFDSNLNPIGDSTWAVENVPAKQAAFISILKRSAPAQ